MNAPKPMYNNIIHIPPADINNAFNNENDGINDDNNDEKDEELIEDEDDEKDILLGMTPGGPNDDITPGGPVGAEPEPEAVGVIDKWINWQPITEEEKDLQFEISAGLIDNNPNIDMQKAIEIARQKIIEMKKNNKPLAIPDDLSSQRRGSQIQSIGPSAQKEKKKRESKLLKKKINNKNENNIQNNIQNDNDNDNDDDAYQMQAKIMAQIQQNQIPII
eukprot:450011_1